MTRQQAQQEREAFNAFCDGRKIESQALNGDGTARTGWELDEDPIFCSSQRHRAVIQPKLVKLGPEDVSPGSVFRHPDWPKGCYESHVEVSLHGVVFAPNRLVSWEQLRNLDISRDGGKTWQRCEKPESV